MEEVALAGHAVVARGRVGHGGRKSRGRVALGEVASPKGRGRVGLTSRPPRGSTRPSEMPPCAPSRFRKSPQWETQVAPVGRRLVPMGPSGKAMGKARRCLKRPRSSARAFWWNTIWGSPRDILGSPEMIDPSVGPDK